MVAHDKLQTTEQLKNRKRKGPVECKVCGQVETIITFFLLDQWRFLFGVGLEIIWGWETIPICREDFNNKYLKVVRGKQNCMNVYILVAVWKIRNMIILKIIW